MKPYPHAIRHMLFLSVLVSWLAAVPAVLAQSADQEHPLVRVRATGQAPAELPNAREAAIESALRRAVEAGAGVELESVSRTEDFMLVHDVITARTAGYVRTYEVLQENPDQDGLYTVRVSAVVERGKFSGDLEAFKSTMKRKGRPTVLVVGTVSGEAAPEAAEIAMQKLLTDRGVRVVDLSAMEEAKRREARLAMVDDKDVRKAAAIADELRAHVLAVVSVQVDESGASEVYGITSHTMSGAMTVRLIDPKTGAVFAAEPVEISGSGKSAGAALRDAIRSGADQAGSLALVRIGQRWLVDLDARGGAEVAIAFDRMSFRQLNTIVEGLRQVEGVKDILIDSTNAKGLSHVRVVTNATAADVASSLSRLDPKLQVRSLTATSIDIGY